MLKHICACLLLLIFFSCSSNKETNPPTIKDISISFDKLQISAFSDSLSGDKGNSKVDTLVITDSSITFHSTLGNKYPYPYAGIEIKSDTSWQNLDEFDSLYIEFGQCQNKYVSLRLKCFIPDVTDSTKDLSYGHWVYNAKIKNNSIQVALDKFQIPDWWYAVNSLQSNQVEIKRSNCYSLDFENSYKYKLKGSLNATINKISFIRKKNN